MDESTSADIAIAAVDALLRVVEQAAHDLHEFHDVVTRARSSSLPTAPRATVALSERIVDKLTTVESDLEEVLLGLGISRPSSSATPNAKEQLVMNPVVDDAVTPEDALRAGQDAIAKYVDGLESPDEALAALDAADRQLEQSQQSKNREATAPRTPKTHTTNDESLSAE
jgi:hypothetical protein